MPLTINSYRSRAFENWQQDRPTFTPRKTYSRAAASVATPERTPVNTKSNGGWAAILATAHDAYMRDRQMTTDERVEMELQKLAHRNKENERDGLSGTTVLSPQPARDALTADALRALDTHREEMGHNDGGAQEMVPSMNYAVAELAKSLEESRKALRKAAKENEELKRQNEELKGERKRRQELEVQQRKFDNWVSPDAHKDLRTGWEEWADVAEKKIESLQTKVGKAIEEKETLLATIKQKKGIAVKLEERVKGFQDWTSPHERKVLDATIDMLNNNLSEMKAESENCQSCVQRHTRAGRRPLMDVTKPVLGRQKTVA